MAPRIFIELTLDGHSEIRVIADSTDDRDRSADAMTRILPHINILEQAVREPDVAPTAGQ